MKLILDLYLFLKFLKEPISLLVFYVSGLLAISKFFIDYVFPLTALKWGVLIILFFMAFISLRFIFFLFRKNYLSAKNTKYKEESEKEIKKIEQEASDAMILILPKTNHLKKMEKISSITALEWAHDAKLLYPSLTIWFRNDSVELWPQFQYFSKWKNQKLIVFAQKKISTALEEPGEFQDFNSYAPFYIKYRQWSWAVEKAYEKMKDLLYGEFKIMISSHYEKLHFVFGYQQGKVKKETWFEFDGNELVSKDGFTLKYSNEARLN